MPPAYVPHAMCCVAFGNVGNLPLVFVAALCHDPHTVFSRRLGARCESLGLSYTAFAILGATVLQFTVAIHLLKPVPALVAEVVGNEDCSPVRGAGADGEGEGDDSAACQARPTPRGGMPGKAGPGPEEEGHLLAAAHASQAWALTRREDSCLSLDARDASVVSVELPLMTLLRPRGPADPTREHEDAGEAGRLLPGAAASGPGRPGYESPPPALAACRAGVGRAAASLAAVPWASFFPLPTQAALAGVAVGCIAPARRALYGDDAPLGFLGDTIETLGDGLIPCTITLLGAVLYR